MDHATGGRFILGLGAGWFEPEHTPFGIPFPPMPERFDRFESGVRVIRALGTGVTETGVTETGVTRPDRFYPLDGATNDPPPLTPGGPPIWLGGQKRRGIALAAEVAQGWLLPAVTPDKSPTDMAYFADRRDAILAALEAVGRDPARSPSGPRSRPEPRQHRVARRLPPRFEAARLGATHIILGMPPRLGADGVDAVAHEVAEPLAPASARLVAGGLGPAVRAAGGAGPVRGMMAPCHPSRCPANSTPSGADWRRHDRSAARIPIPPRPPGPSAATCGCSS